MEKQIKVLKVSECVKIKINLGGNMKNLKLTICLILLASLTTIAYARPFVPNQNLFRRTIQDHNDKKMIFETNSAKYVNQYRGQKDDYDPNQFSNDPAVLVSGNINRDSHVLVAYSSDVVLLIDKKIKSLRYDNIPKTIDKSKTVNEVLSSGSGNCYESAIVAFDELTARSFKALVLEIYFDSTPITHAVTVFQEKDGTWSMFQASSDNNKGYKLMKNQNYMQSIEKLYPSATNVNIIKQ